VTPSALGTSSVPAISERRQAKLDGPPTYLQCYSLGSDSGAADMLATILLMLLVGVIPCAVIIAVYEILARRSLSRFRH